MDQEWEPAVSAEYLEIPGDEKDGLTHNRPEEAKLTVEVAAISDIGYKRTNNEDNFGYDLQSQVFVVCDGMGGMAAGEIASSTAVDRLLRYYDELGNTPMDIEERLHQAIVKTNLAVWTAAQKSGELRGMGTTLVTACLDGKRIWIGNIGDSRAYFLREGGCVQITQDHSCAAEQSLRGKMQGIPASGILRQFITRAIGVEATVQADLFTAEVRPGDVVLLATDGLTRYASTGEIAQCIGNDWDLAKSCRKLVEIAKQQGAADNVTCLLLRFQ